jgi:hypothetical protein
VEQIIAVAQRAEPALADVVCGVLARMDETT